MKHISFCYCLALLFVCLMIGSCKKNATTASPISLTWQHVGNDVSQNVCASQLTIKNISSDTLGSNWAIYWNQMSVKPIYMEGAPLELRQIQASYHTLVPTTTWQPLPPDSSLTLTLYYNGNIMRRSGAPQGAFIVMNSDAPQTIITNYLYSPDAHEYRRQVAGGFPYADGEETYARNERFHSIIEETLFLGVLPYPKHIETKEGECNLKKAKKVYLTDDELPEEGYRLVIEQDSVIVFSSTEAGKLYAEQTLALLQIEQKGLLTCCQITDWPDTKHRGLMLDIARNFTPKQEILKIIDLLAMYKMNVLHLHMTDDEGWRIEIDGLPELTEVGSKRGYTTDERDCLYPMYSGGWDMNDISASANGYLTRQDFIEILRYAKNRNIKVLPEIDMPGHSRAAIKAMEARYWKYIETDKDKAEEYLLTDFQDTSKYVSAQHYTDNVICIALPSCYTFCKKVIDEVVDMYVEAQAPLEIFHVGGDEVPRGAWLGSPKVAEYVASRRMHVEMLQNNQSDNVQKAEVTAQDVADLKDSFLEVIAAILADYGLQTAGWEEVAYRRGKPNPRFANRNILTYAWNSVPEWRGDEKPYQLANAGYPVMICSVGNLYLDMCYINHEEEAGLNWGGYVDEYCTFDLRPDSLYLSVRRTMLGKERDLQEYVKSDKTRLIPDSAKNIQGVQAQLWSETIRNSEQLETYLLPKLLGTAERTWNNSWNGDYEDALNKYNHQLYKYQIPYLSKSGYAFRVSPAGIRREGDKVYMNSAIVGAQIRYTLDGTEPNEQSALYTEPFETDASLINARCFYLGRQSAVTHDSK